MILWATVDICRAKTEADVAAKTALWQGARLLVVEL